jgi:hypothetical protein
MKSLKTILFFAVILFAGNSSFAQTASKLAGKWNAVTVDISELVYVNIDKDSVQISDKMIAELEKSGEMDSSTKATTMAILKSSLLGAFKKMSFTIDDKGGIYESDKDKKIGQIDAVKNTITFTDEDTKTEKTIPVEMKNGLLKLMIVDAEDVLEIWCRKA